jgi:hypothetical protein
MRGGDVLSIQGKRCGGSDSEILLIFLWVGRKTTGVEEDETRDTRPDIAAAVRGGDPEQGMDGEGDPATASLEQALYWREIYREILAMEEKVLKRIQDLMAKQSPTARREVEQSNVPVVTAQAERFRHRLRFWTTRVSELE